MFQKLHAKVSMTFAPFDEGDLSRWEFFMGNLASSQLNDSIGSSLPDIDNNDEVNVFMEYEEGVSEQAENLGRREEVNTEEEISAAWIDEDDNEDEIAAEGVEEEVDTEVDISDESIEGKEISAELVEDSDDTISFLKDEFESCSICQQQIDFGRLLSCNHVFHLNCLSRWFIVKKNCPNCRKEA